MSEDLIKRLEQASGPEIKLDDAIYDYLINSPGWRAGDIPFANFTRSIAAALTLVPEGSVWTIADHNDNGKFFAMVDGCEVLGATSAIALANAALRARAAVEAKAE